ncbi:MAG: dodecin family protein [bacterium]|nr:dodecin family protein [bacterium]
MSVLKVLEILSSSPKSWEAAAESAVAEASKTVRDIRSVNISNMSAKVENGKISEYRLNCKVTFEVGG